MSGSQPYGALANQVSTGRSPKSPQAYSFPITLVLNATTQVDLKPLANLHRIENVQGIFIDNSLGIATLSVSTAAGQIIKIPASYQGVLPLYLSADNVVTFSGNGSITISLLNFQTPVAVWPTALPSLTITGLVQTQDAIAEASLGSLQGAVTTLVSRSVAVSVSAVSTVLMPANVSRKYLLIAPPYAIGTGFLTGGLWVNFLGGVAGVGLVDSFYIPPGLPYETAVRVTTTAVTYFDPAGLAMIAAMEG